MLAPHRKVKNKSLRQAGTTDLDLLRNYQKALVRHGAQATEIASFDLDNSFYWLFRLSELIARGYERFDRLNLEQFSGKYTRPLIQFCSRSTGGYYHKGRHEIGISLSMTVEHGEKEFFETLLHEIAHIAYHAHSPKFYELLSKLGGSGRKAPMTLLLSAKRATYVERNYPVIVRCPNCLREHRYRTRRALRYACRPCCTKFAGGKFDSRFKFVLEERDSNQRIKNKE